MECILSECICKYINVPRSPNSSIRLAFAQAEPSTPERERISPPPSRPPKRPSFLVSVAALQHEMEPTSQVAPSDCLRKAAELLSLAIFWADSGRAMASEARARTGIVKRIFDDEEFVVVVVVVNERWLILLLVLELMG